MNSLVILAGGLGLRAKQKEPKQFFLLDDKKSIRLMYLQYPYLENNTHQFNEIIIVVPNMWKSIIQDEIKTLCPITKVIEGGDTRTESSYKGLKACSSSCKNVLIHDAARPFASSKLYDSCIKHLKEYDAVIPLVETKDTTIYIEPNNNKQKGSFVNRDFLKSIQTPQAFKYNIIREAYDNKVASKTDDLQIMIDYYPKSKIRFIQGEYSNFKVTTKKDLKIIKALYDSNNYRVLYQ